MKIGKVEGTSNELKELLSICGFKQEEYFPQSYKNKWTYILIILIFIFVLIKII